jgi:hypothetical protein
MATRKKIEIGFIIALVALCLTLATKLVAHGSHERGQDASISQLEIQHLNMQPKVDKIDVIENDIKYIKAAADEMKSDVKEILRRTP